MTRPNTSTAGSLARFPESWMDGWCDALGVTVEAFHVHDGPWLNLLGPIAFYVLAIRVAGRRAGVDALCDCSR